MKTTLRTMIYLAFVTGLVANAFGQKVCFDNEYPVNMEKFFTPRVGPAGIKIKRFENNFTVAEPDSLKPSNSVIVMKAFLKLYKLADDLAKAQNLRDRTLLRRYITGVEISFGLSRDNQIELFYQPWFLRKTNNSRKKAKGSVHFVDESLFYKYSNGSFETEHRDSVGNSLGRFEDRILIRHRDKWDFGEMSHKTNWKGDAKSAHFSFQELFFLYELNYDTLDPDFTYNYSIRSIEGATYKKNFKLNFFALMRYKQTAMFNCEECEIPEGLGPVAGDPANLAHMCPPRCNQLSFPLDNQ